MSEGFNEFMWTFVKNNSSGFFSQKQQSSLSTFFYGKKPSNTNLSLGNPEFTKAGTKAVAPGKQSTSIPFSIQARANKNPGSEMAGVPASLIKARLYHF